MIRLPNTNWVTKHWELDPTDITSELCKKCIKSGPPHCCELGIGTHKDPEYMELLVRAIEGYDHLRIDENDQLKLMCSHLDQKNGVCTIYEDRPSVCRDYNCVSWAKRSFSEGAPAESLEIYNKVVEVFKK